MTARFSIPTAPAAYENTYVYGNVRIAVILDGLLRVETKPFSDLPTQKVWHRNMGAIRYTTMQEHGILHVTTSRCTWTLTENGKLLYVQLGGSRVDNFRRGNLGGTARTLDNTVGPIGLEKGIISTTGVCVMEDNSLLLDGDKVVRRKAGKDYYVFAYGHDYRACMAAFYAICGAVPMIPRYALGNWWSRYKAYSQQEYLDVIAHFEAERIPISVATIDMDWHWVDVKRRFGREARPHPTRNFADHWMAALMPGWTGYSWNTELFPDHKAMFDQLRKGGYHITLNVHPSHGVRPFEDCYPAMCEAMGLDPTQKPYIEFKLGDKRFLEAYFDVLHHPYEKEGVDFWWLDWQQGTHSDVPGLDPLWAVNHYHYLDSDRGNKRGLILSRYAGEGSHRYPLGFSGDTYMNWASLNFQPYFTANAANAGYTWWSHDIGGHHFGRKNDELYLRWVQFGIFSPIHRLHSSANEFMGKEPWKCGGEAHAIIRDCMRLRHKLIPYLYTAAYMSHTTGAALCEPMYYGNPEDPEAYKVPNQYRFGSQLIVAPITEPVDAATLRGSVRVWLPEGTYTDIFTGGIYRGGRTYTMWRDTHSIPVLAPAGAIIPMYSQADTNDVANDQEMELLLYHGDGDYELYEDDGETKDYQKGKYARTAIHQRLSGDTLTVTIDPPTGDTSVLPACRNYVLHFADVASATATVDDWDITFQNGKIMVEVDTLVGCTVTLTDCVFRTNPPLKEQIVDIISSYQIRHGAKRRRFGKLVAYPTERMHASKRLRGPVEEVQAMHAALEDQE